MVQKARANGFEGAFYEDEKAAAMQLLWEHLVHAKDQAAAVAALRRELDEHLAEFCQQWEVPTTETA
jgi:hypothetical protein